MKRSAWIWMLVVGCGGAGTDDLDGGVPGSMDADVNSPACKACANTLNVETGQCTTSFNQCSSVEQQPTEYYKLCFLNDAQCYDGSLDRASTCHSACGDTEQANVETCTGDCFLTRGICHTQVLDRADACFETCNGAACMICRSHGITEASDCDDTAQACADTCVATHRPG
jgi:hypothetical protein